MHKDALKLELEAALAGFDCAELADRLIHAGVPCGAVRSLDQVVADPHTAHREMIVDIEAYRGTGSPIKLSRTPASYRLAPPQFAQHTAEIMRDLALDSDAYQDALPGLTPDTEIKTA